MHDEPAQQPYSPIPRSLYSNELNMVDTPRWANWLEFHLKQQRLIIQHFALIWRPPRLAFYHSTLFVVMSQISSEQSQGDWTCHSCKWTLCFNNIGNNMCCGRRTLTWEKCSSKGQLASNVSKMSLMFQCRANCISLRKDLVISAKYFTVFSPRATV